MELQGRYKLLGVIIIIVNIALFILIVVFLFINMIKEQNLIPPPQFSLKMRMFRDNIKEKIFSSNYKHNKTCRDYLGYFFMIRIGFVIDYENDKRTPYMASLAGILKDYSIVPNGNEAGGKIRMTLKATNSRTLNYFHESKPILLNYMLEINSTYNESKPIDDDVTVTKELTENPVQDIYQKALKNKQTSLVPLNLEVIRIWGYEIETRVYFKTYHRIETRTTAKSIRKSTNTGTNTKSKFEDVYEIDVISHEFDRNAKICRIKNGLYLLFYPTNARNNELSDTDFYIPEKITVLAPDYVFVSASLYTGNFRYKQSLKTVKNYINNMVGEKTIDGQNKKYIFLMYSEYKFDVKDDHLHILLKTKVLRVRKVVKDKGKQINKQDGNANKYNYTMMFYYPLIKDMISGVPVIVK